MNCPHAVRRARYGRWLVAGLLLVGGLARADNLLLNSGFLYCSNPGIPTMWDAGNCKFNADWPGCWRPDQEAALPGVKSMRLTNPEARSLYLQSCYAGATLPRGKPYAWSVYLKTDTPGGKVRIFHSAVGTPAETITATVVEPTTAWQRYSGGGVITTDQSSTTYLRVEWQDKGTLWVCAPQFEAGEQPTPYAPSPVDPQAGKPSPPPVRPKWPPAQAACPVLDGAPHLDGRLDDACWAKAARLTGFTLMDAGRPAREQTEVYLGRDGSKLYLGIRCFESSMGGLVTKAAPVRNAPVFLDDEVEVFLSAYASGQEYRQFALNAANARYEGIDLDGGAWDGPWESATAREEQAWTAEVAIPFAALSFGPGVGDKWRLNVARHRAQPTEEYSTWSRVAGGFHDIERFGLLTGMTGPALTAWEVGFTGLTEGQGQLRLGVWSAGRQTGTLEVQGEKDEPLRSVPVRLAGGPRSVDLGPREAFPGGAVRLRFLDPAGAVIATGGYPLPEGSPLFEAWLDRSYYAAPAAVKVVAHTSRPQTRFLVTAEGAAERTVARPDDLGWAEIPVPPAGRGPGSYGVSVSLVDGAGKALGQTHLAALVQAPGANMVPWDPSTGCLIVKGKPFIPLAIGGGGITVKTVQDAASVGFNAMHVWFHSPTKWPDPADPALVRQVLDEAEHLGIGIIPATTLMPSTCKTFAEWKEKAIGLFVQSRESPAILAWDTIDEPGPGWEREPDWKESNLQELHDACRAADPWRPAFVNYYAWRPGYGFYGGLNSTDICSMDCYVLGNWYGGNEPYRPFNKSMEIQVQLYERLHADARRQGKPAHFWLHFYGGGDSYREPSVAEDRAQTWLALVHGFRMLSYFVYRPMSLDLWHSILPLSNEVAALTPVFGTPALPGVIHSGSPALHCAAFRQGGAWYFVTVNATDQPVKATLALQGPKAGAVEVMFEQRSLRCDGRTLSDEWPPMDRHVYRLPMK